MKYQTLKFSLEKGIPKGDKMEFDFDLSHLVVKLKSVPSDTSISYSTKRNGVISKQSSEFSKLSPEGVDELFLHCITNTDEATVEVEVEYAYVEHSTKCSASYDSLNLDSMVQKANELELAMQKVVSANDGIQVLWYRTEPTFEDVVLKEYNGRKYVEQKCLRILTEDNMYPEIIDAEFTEYGIETIDFPAEVVAAYFEDVFGCRVSPREGDWIVVLATNRALRISSVVPERGVDGSVLIWKLVLSNFYDETDIDGKDDFIEMTDSHEKMFSEEIEEEIENVVNDKQNIPPQIYGDVNRVYISPDVTYTQTSKGIYMYSLVSGAGDAIKYKTIIDPVRTISMLVSGASDCTLIQTEMGDISVVSGVVKVLGMSSGYQIPEYEKMFLNISFYENFTSLQVLDFNYNEVFYSEEMSPRMVSGELKLAHSDLEIGHVRISKKVTLRKDGVRLASTNMEQKSGDFYIIDDAIQPYNNPRAKENQFRTNL